MGAVAARLADLVIVTDDNPRSEDPAAIRRAILAGAPAAREVPGRREAIAAAIAEAGADDIVLLAGKGHEQGQIVGDRASLRRRRRREGVRGMTAPRINWFDDRLLRGGKGGPRRAITEAAVSALWTSEEIAAAAVAQRMAISRRAESPSIRARSRPGTCSSP
jgi:hypothetical protein